MGFGKCVVSIDIPQNKYLVERFGYTFKTGDTQSLADVLNYLFEHPEIVSRAGHVACNTVGLNCSWEICANRHLDLFLNR